MGEFSKQFGVWLKSTFSEPDGTGSMSRLLSFLMALVVSGILVMVFHHLLKITDSLILGTWLESIPILIAALVLFYTSPYGINRGSTSISSVLSSLANRGQKNPDPLVPPPPPQS